MKILANKLRELAEHVEVLGAQHCQADPVTADLLWSMAGRLRYRANQVNTEKALTTLRQQVHDDSGDNEPESQGTAGSAILQKAAKEHQAKLQGVTPLARHRLKLPADLRRLIARNY